LRRGTGFRNVHDVGSIVLANLDRFRKRLGGRLAAHPRRRVLFRTGLSACAAPPAAFHRFRSDLRLGRLLSRWGGHFSLLRAVMLYALRRLGLRDLAAARL
jgi:hypothetical protein